MEPSRLTEASLLEFTSGKLEYPKKKGRPKGKKK
jgi:hypothetical protein